MNHDDPQISKDPIEIFYASKLYWASVSSSAEMFGR